MLRSMNLVRQGVVRRFTTHAAPPSVAVGTTEVRVRLGDAEHRLHPLWLRLNDPAGITPNGQRLFEISSVVREPPAWTVAAFCCCYSSNDGALHVEWQDGATSRFPRAIRRPSSALVRPRYASSL